ncbi:MAG: ADP-ribosylglycohydrolase family protein [Chloroflexota bacterium]|nr:ADP-ribosylglycohydrolase family protein [Chloroflexota bacterium]MDE2958878.1 ADP-ribosylglycohydrolase family protein [Chloroflexota bacterium]
MNDTGIVAQSPNLVALLADAIANGPNWDARERARDTVLAERARGVLLGLACGNLLGLPVEGRWHYDIAYRYPQGVLFIDPHERDRDLDDDLAQAVELAEAFLSGDDYVRGFAGRLIEWAWVNGRGMGGTTRRVINRMRDSADALDAARLVYEQSPIAPNGGVMRCAPVAIVRRSDPALLISDSAATCAVTHYANTCQWSCILINAVIALFLNGVEPDLPAIYASARADGCPDLQEIARADGILAYALDAVAAGENPPAGTAWLLDDHGLIGHTLLAMQFGLWAATTPLGFEDALVASVSAGGDTDTNAAVAGAVLGARYDTSAIPRRWIDCIPQRQRIVSLANGLLTMGRR